MRQLGGVLAPGAWCQSPQQSFGRCPVHPSAHPTPTHTSSATAPSTHTGWSWWRLWLQHMNSPHFTDICQAQLAHLAGRETAAHFVVFLLEQRANG